jgi:hypothetical protein
MKRTICKTNVVRIAQKMYTNSCKAMGLTWNETIKFSARELADYNKNGGYGAIADTFLIAAYQLGLDK